MADLVVLSENPLEDIENVVTTRAVVAAGTFLDRKALDQLIDNAKRSLH
jgi:2-keto-3-deoxy-6-phosphogluconate aldolase